MIAYPINPVLTDVFMVEFNTKIQTALTWLNNPLGKVQAVTKITNGRSVRVPRMFVSGREYDIEVFPNDKITNFSWFVFSGASTEGRKRQARVSIPATFNMFLDLRKIYPLVTQSRDLENAKLEVISALNSMTLRNSTFRLTGMSEKYEDVYRGFALPAEQDKYFLHPYAGLSFELDLQVNTQVIDTCIEP